MPAQQSRKKRIERQYLDEARAASSVFPARQYVENAGGALIEICEKDRHGAGFPTFRLRAVPVHVGTDEDGEPISACVLKTVATPTTTTNKLTAKHRALLDVLDQQLPSRRITSIPRGEWHQAMIAADPNAWNVQMTFYRVGIF